MSTLKDLEQELAIARRLNFDSREIKKLENLIEKEKNRSRLVRYNARKRHSLTELFRGAYMSLSKIFLWIIGIILMAVFSFSAYPQGEENLPDETEIEISPIPSLRKRGNSEKVRPNDKEVRKDSKGKKEKSKKVKASKIKSEAEIEYELTDGKEMIV